MYITYGVLWALYKDCVSGVFAGFPKVIRINYWSCFLLIWYSIIKCNGSFIYGMIFS